MPACPQARSHASALPHRRRRERARLRRSPEFDNKGDKTIKLYWIKNNGEEKWMCDMAPGAHRPPGSWIVYPRVGCWMAKEGGVELLRVSSTTVVEYGFQIGGGALESKNEKWVPHGQPGAEEPPDELPEASKTAASGVGGTAYNYSSYNKKSPTGFCGLSCAARLRIPHRRCVPLPAAHLSRSLMQPHARWQEPGRDLLPEQPAAEPVHDAGATRRPLAVRPPPRAALAQRRAGLSR